MHARSTNAPVRALVALAAMVAAGGLAACGDESAASDEPDRPMVTFTADDTSIEAPDEVPSGLVDLRLETVAGELGHHIFVARLHDGVTFQEAMDDDASFFTSMTIKGGNGTIASGETALMTMDLEPGNYFVLDNPQNETSPTDTFTVVEGEPSRTKPDAKGTVSMGPGMVIDLPDDFDGRGTWEFVNRDTVDVHEAAMVRLVDGTTADDLIAWFTAGGTGPSPIDGEFGSMGAIGPGQRAWMELEPGEPGNYVVICFIPGTDGIPHIAKGMVTPFEVR